MRMTLKEFCLGTVASMFLPFLILNPIIGLLVISLVSYIDIVQKKGGKQ